MSDDPRMRLRYFENAASQRHVEAHDQYVYRRATPRWTLNVIGTGTIGQEHMRVAALLGRARIHGIYDAARHSVDVARDTFATYAQTPLATYASLEDACNDPAADALVICTPNYTHYDVLRVAAASGKPILLEKPMATTLADAAAIVELARSREAPLHVGLQYRFKSIYSEAEHELLSRRCVGDIKTLRMLEHRPPFLDKVGQWNKFNEYSGGTLIEKCCHYFDLLNRFAQSRPVRVFASGGQAVNFKNFTYDGKRSDIMDNAVVTIEYANGIRANFELNMFCPNFDEELVACGDAGRLTARESFNTFHHQTTRCDLAVEHDEAKPSRKTELAHASDVEQSGHHGATYFEHAAFFDALEGKPSKIATVDEGFWSIVVGAAAQQSTQSGQAVDVAAMLEAAKLTHLTGESS